MKQSTIGKFLISLVVILYLGVSLVSTFHVIDFFQLTNVAWASVLLAIMFEIGQMGTLFLITSEVMKKVKKGVVWSLFIILTGMQVMGNMYYAYVHAEGFVEWVELFGLENESLIFQKRILAFVAGGILPLVALGFVKSLSDYLNPDEKNKEIKSEEQNGLGFLTEDKEAVVQEKPVERPNRTIQQHEPIKAENNDFLPQAKMVEETSDIVESDELRPEPINDVISEDNNIQSEKDMLLDKIHVYKNVGKS